MENYGKGRGRSGVSGGGRNSGDGDGGRVSSMQNYGKGRGRRGVSGGRRNSGDGGRGRGENLDYRPSNYENFPAQQRGYRPVPGQHWSGTAPHQFQSSEPRRPIFGQYGSRKGPSSNQGQFAESTRPVSAWVGSVRRSSTSSGVGGSSSSGRGGVPWKASYSGSGSGPPVSEQKSLEISCPLKPSPPPESGNIVPVRRPDNGVTTYVQEENLPCLDLGRNGKSNDVPTEFCVLAEGQRYPKDHLDKDPANKLKHMSLPKPWEGGKFICDMVQASDGPLRGDTACKFDIEPSPRMTEVIGRGRRAPDLKIGDSSSVACKLTHDREDGGWFLECKDIERWAILDFSSFDRRLKPNSLECEKFTQQLMALCGKLGIRMKAPLFHELSDMCVLSEIDRLRMLLHYVNDRANHQLQILVCPMMCRPPGYNALEWICETEVGIVTQCCLSDRCNIGKDDYLANLALEINTKLGGRNFEPFDHLPGLESDDHVMFIGADVSHPSPGDALSPSVAAVVATINWPAANKYVACYRLQGHQKEKILQFGEMCLELINKYFEVNKVKPKKIIIFRDGVSNSQFDIVLIEELMDLKTNLCESYSPTITLVIAQKQHQTRLCPMVEKREGRGGNVFPGTVVDTTVVHPWGHDFYLCSHYGLLGTSNPTHYYRLWDDHKFSSDQLQQIINNLCHTFGRSTKPVSLVPPAYHADSLAYNVRQYYEAWEADCACASSSSFSPQLDAKIFELHSDLENVMFFS